MDLILTQSYIFNIFSEKYLKIWQNVIFVGGLGQSTKYPRAIFCPSAQGQFYLILCLSQIALGQFYLILCPSQIAL